MADDRRFSAVDESDILSLLDAADSKNTKSVIKYSERILDSFLKKDGSSLEEMASKSLEEIMQTLRKFYVSARNQKGQLYSKSSMISIRYGLQKSLEKSRKIDIVNGEIFQDANAVFSAMLKKLKNEGKGVTEHKEPLSKADLVKLYTYLENESCTPSVLQNKVFLDYMLYFCNRGRENLRSLKKDDFRFCGEGSGRYIQLKDMKTKNHSGDTTDNGESQGGRMYGIPDSSKCPLKSFVLYLSHLHPECEYFWQRPKSQVKSDIWYDNVPLGVNTLGNKMKILSSVAGLSSSYTNHCLRATAVTLLDGEGFEARHIMAISGHKSETSIKNYARTDEGHKRKMSAAIGSAVSTEEIQVPSTAMKRPRVSAKTYRENLQSGPGAANAVGSSLEPHFDDGLSDMDLLALTDSQEAYLLHDITNTLQCTSAPAPQNLPAPVINIPKSMNHQTVMNFSNVQNVHVHYH